MVGLSDHARKRIKLRADGDPEKLLKDAVEHGARAAEFNGKFGRYLVSFTVSTAIPATGRP